MLEGEVKGLLELQRKKEQIVADMRGGEFLNAMRDATLWVQRGAKKLAPVDTGQLRNSIVPEIRTHEKTVEGAVGTNKKHGPYMELGTRPHWPPIKALEVWARRHHTSAYVVARAIARRGIKARRFLQQGFEQNQDRIKRHLDGAVGRIVTK
jgi:hypothetical protein